MKRVDAAFLSLRLLAVYMWYASITHLVHLYYTAMANAYTLEWIVDWRVMVQLHALPSVVLLSFGILLWAFAGKCAGILARGQTSTDSASLHISFPMLLSVAGIVIIIVSVGGLVRAIPVYFSEYAAITNALASKRQLYEMLSQAVKLALGLGLVLYARKVSSWLRGFVADK